MWPWTGYGNTKMSVVGVLWAVADCRCGGHGGRGAGGRSFVREMKE